MLRVTLDSPEKLVFEEVERPAILNDEVLINIKRIGICGSDIHAYYGKHPTVFLPIVQGHEFAGEIAECGSDVKEFQIGDAVTVRPQYVCKTCYHCQTGHENVCHNLKVIGCQVPGAAQEYLPVKSELVFKLPSGMSMDDGSMIEPVAVGVAAVRSFGSNLCGKNILVLGAGTIGNLTAQCAKGLGAASVAITDISNFKLDVAKQCGIDHTINTAKEDLNEALTEIYGVDKLDGILECVGSEITVNQAISVSRKESEIIIVGVYGERPAIDMINVQEKELKLIGTLMYQEEDYYEAIRLISEEKICLKPLKTRHFPLREYDKAYKYIEENQAASMKVLIDVD